MSEQFSGMSVIPVNENIQRGDFAMLPGCDAKPVTELTGEWVGMPLCIIRNSNKFDHPSHTMVILRPEQQPEPDPEWFDLTPHDGHVLRVGIDEGYCTLAGRNKWVEGVQWPEGTTVADAKSWRWDQFRCLLKDAPPELLKPIESPDDWVTQDRVHMRANIDETRWVRDVPGDRWVGEWKIYDGFSPSYRHGDTQIGNKYYRIEIRCRRRDLPPIPEPKPATETIVFHECIVKHSWDNEPSAFHLEWTSDVSKHSNWIPTGKTETREVVR